MSTGLTVIFISGQQLRLCCLCALRFQDIIKTRGQTVMTFFRLQEVHSKDIFQIRAFTFGGQFSHFRDIFQTRGFTFRGHCTGYRIHILGIFLRLEDYIRGHFSGYRIHILGIFFRLEDLHSGDIFQATGFTFWRYFSDERTFRGHSQRAQIPGERLGDLHSENIFQIKGLTFYGVIRSDMRMLALELFKKLKFLAAEIRVLLIVCKSVNVSVCVSTSDSVHVYCIIYPSLT